MKIENKKDEEKKPKKEPSWWLLFLGFLLPFVLIALFVAIKPVPPPVYVSPEVTKSEQDGTPLVRPPIPPDPDKKLHW